MVPSLNPTILAGLFSAPRSGDAGAPAGSIIEADDLTGIAGVSAEDHREPAFSLQFHRSVIPPPEVGFLTTPYLLTSLSVAFGETRLYLAQSFGCWLGEGQKPIQDSTLKPGGIRVDRPTSSFFPASIHA